MTDDEAERARRLHALLPPEMARRAEEIGAAKVAMDPLATLALAAPAKADTWNVQGTGDGAVLVIASARHDTSIDRSWTFQVPAW